jgi:catechol 2,3-dioxygenase-like lactoylglutathione lyase family enzyme
MDLMSIRIGTNDLDKARAFYDATFAALGLAVPAAGSAMSVAFYKLPSANFVVGPARDGDAATHANGGTILFSAEDDAAVAAWHAAGIAHGGSSEGDPEPKPQARGAFGAYLRDPDGNKLGAFCGLKMG